MVTITLVVILSIVGGLISSFILTEEEFSFISFVF